MPPLGIPAHLAAAIQDPNFERSLKALVEVGSRIMPEVVAASRKTGNTGTLDERIAERSEFSRVGVKLAVMTGSSSLLVEGLAPRQNPPIYNGMMYCVNLVDKIVRRDYRAGQKHELAKLPYLLKRIRHLLRVFYNFRVGGRQHPDLVFCDWEQMFQVGITLHDVGLCLQLDPPRLRAVMAAGGHELEEFLLDDELDVGDFRKAAIVIERRVAADPESEDTDRMAASDIENVAEKDLAAHVLSWFFGDISVAFVLHENIGSDSDERRWASKAMARLVHWSTSETLRSALGDPLTDAMRPIYWSMPLLIKFSQAGGLGAVFGDWVGSFSYGQFTFDLSAQTCCTTKHPTLRALPYLWTLSSIFTASTASRRSIKAARNETHHTPVVFYYVAHCIKRDGLQMRTRADWVRLLTSYVDMPHSTEQRYRWGNMTISGRWDCLEFHGCCAGEACPERRALEALREKRVRGVRDPKVEARLDAWGAKPKACAACGMTAYCSAACQRAHWPKHKLDCLKKRKSAKARQT
ncbi:MYND-type domain-containing protein [Mycena venus]|uniref:MYND-type domain-containing protein n=1 Tax=Mycena venus TaxID=2733690 RepID=A0A8H7CP56_9AGAR|nr:MYND-type domain-containing protein [Mycena venus]